MTDDKKASFEDVGRAEAPELPAAGMGCNGFEFRFMWSGAYEDPILVWTGDQNQGEDDPAILVRLDDNVFQGIDRSSPLEYVKRFHQICCDIELNFERFTGLKTGEKMVAKSVVTDI